MIVKESFAPVCLTRSEKSPTSPDLRDAKHMVSVLSYSSVMFSTEATCQLLASSDGRSPVSEVMHCLEYGVVQVISILEMEWCQLPLLEVVPVTSALHLEISSYLCLLRILH